MFLKLDLYDISKYVILNFIFSPKSKYQTDLLTLCNTYISKQGIHFC